MFDRFRKGLSEATPNAFTRGDNVAARRATSGGLSEEAMKGLDDLDARLPPPNVMTKPAFTRGFTPTSRLSQKHAAGGGILTSKDGKSRPHYLGHRERLRQRFLKGGHDPMPEYEVLELLLFNAIPRIDVKPLAKRLLEAVSYTHLTLPTTPYV